MTAPAAALAGRLREIVGADGVLTDPADCAPFLVDHLGRCRGRAVAVVQPRSLAQVSQLLGLCDSERIGVVPHGGNTSYCGGAIPDDSGRQLVLSLKHLNRIRSVDVTNYSLTAEAGCILSQVQQAADAAGCFFPLSLGSQGSCQIGGNLSTNAGGVNVLRYGMMRDLVLGLEVVLPGGRVLEGLSSLRKDNTGYDIKSLFLGAEGTLGVITAATVKLFPQIRGDKILRADGRKFHPVDSLRGRAGKTVTCEEVLPSPQDTFDQREHIVSRAVGQMHPDFLFTDSVAPFTEATDTPPARRRDPGSRRLACCELEMLRCSRQVSAKCEPRIVIEGVNFAADLSCGGNSWIVLDPVDKGVSGDDKVEQAIRGYLILQ